MGKPSSSVGTTTLVGFRPAQLSLSILSRKVLLSALPAARLTPNLEENQGFRAFHLSPKEAPASEATLANPAAEDGTMGEKWPSHFAESGDFHVTFGFFYMP
jgi:hypothetical protein